MRCCLSTFLAVICCVIAVVHADIWQPEVNATWQWQLQFAVNTSFDVDMYDVDLFDVETSVFEQIKARGMAVICYFSAGTQEDWREDADDFPESALGEPLGDWEGEVWVDVNDEGVRDVMVARLDLALEKGCDGVEADNVQVYLEEGVTGVSVTADQQLDYNIFLATEAHNRNLSIGLKNDLEHLVELEPYFDWAINESCFEYDECDGYDLTFLRADKAVFNAEYEKDDLSFCVEANAMGLSSLLKSYDLGPERCSCQDRSTDNQCALLLEEGEVPPPTSSTTSETDDEVDVPTTSETDAPTASPRSSSGARRNSVVAAAGGEGLLLSLAVKLAPGVVVVLLVGVFP